MRNGNAEERAGDDRQPVSPRRKAEEESEVELEDLGWKNIPVGDGREIAECIHVGEDGIALAQRTVDLFNSAARSMLSFPSMC